MHGDNVRISRDGSIAKRYESFCKGVAFSARPIRVNERVCIKFLEISNNWSGVLRFGFTCVDPSSLRSNLPKYVCPDLTNKPGFWAKALNERYCIRNNVLFYYVTPNGDVHFGINGEEKGVFITDVEARSPLWAVIDIYGNSTAIEFLDSRVYMFQKHNHHSSTPSQSSSSSSAATSQEVSCRRSEISLDVVDSRLAPALENLNLQNEERSLQQQQQQQQLQLQQQQQQQLIIRPQYTQQHISQQQQQQLPQQQQMPMGVVRLSPMQFHKTKGRNIRLSSDYLLASRMDTEFCQGYVFTARPIRLNEQIIIQILKTEKIYVGALALGLTSCDPATLSQSDLPDDSDSLLDRPEYWVVSKDVASVLNAGDEIRFCITTMGEVQISKNGGAPQTVMYVDQSLKLWAFLDIYGSTQSVKIFSQSYVQAASAQSQIQHRPVIMPNCSSTSSSSSLHHTIPDNTMQSIRPLTATTSQHSINSTNSRIQAASAATTDMIQVQSGGTILVVNLPPSHSSTSELHTNSAAITRVGSMPISTSSSSVSAVGACGAVEPILENQIASAYSNSYNIEVS